MKKFLIVLLLALCVGACVSCGGSSSLGSLCKETASKVFEVCDKNNPTDVQTIITFYANFRQTVTTSDVAASTEETLAESCTSDLDPYKDDLEDSAVKDYKDGLKLQTNCQALASYVTYWVYLLTL
jgi:hypothetical protein